MITNRRSDVARECVTAGGVCRTSTARRGPLLAMFNNRSRTG